VTNPPAWTAQVIEVVEPDPAWSGLANQLCAALQPLLSAWLDGTVEHVGSTAVPGLPAKPVVDLMAPVRSLADSAAAREPLAGAGWVVVPPELDERPWRHFYVLPDGARRVAHLHLVERAHPRWRETLAFRDALRARPQLAGAYADLKRDLAARYRTDREAYTDAKAAFIENALSGVA
jgi:GrpB-like predicted nucleotidyltransferase (UPF0157 family)